VTAQPRYLDPTGGIADLRAGVIRAVSPTSLTDDPLRTLRAWRFAATLGFAIDPATVGLVRLAAPGLATVASERVHQEWLPLLAAPGAPAAVAGLAASGVLAVLLPGLPKDQPERVAKLEPVLAARQPRLAAWRAGSQRLALTRFATLVGPVDRSAVSATELEARFALSRAERQALAGLRSSFPEELMAGDGLAELALRLGPDALGRLAVAVAWDELDAATYEAASARLADDVLPRWEARPLVTGDDLQREGHAPGPGFGPALHAARLAQLAGRLATREAALELAAKELLRDA
jgi:tRNA nucleotidyltransferase/poly(A) polymerase